MKQIYSLSYQDAQKVLGVIEAELEKQGKGAAVAVVDAHGELMCFVRTDGCPLPSINNAINKAFSSAREGRASREIGERSREEGWPLSNFADPRYIGWGGGVPLIYEGQIVGGVGVSGLPEADDMVLAKLGAAALV